MDLTHLNEQKKNGQRRQSKALQIYGHVPPQAKDIEEAVLGACMLEKDAYHRINQWLKPEVFYVDAHQKIFQAIASLAERSQTPDILTVVEELKKNGDLDMANGPYYVTKMTNAVVSGTNLEVHAKIILEKFIKRRLIVLAMDMANQAYEDQMDVFDLMEAGSEAFYFLQESIYSGKTVPWDKVLMDSIIEFEKEPPPDGLTGAPTGFRSIDRKTAGWQEEDLVILAARPSMGKTALAGQMAFRPAYLYNVPTAFFSLEMSTAKISTRIISAESKQLLAKLLRRDLTPEDRRQIFDSMRVSAGAPLYFNDSPNQTLLSICAECRKLKRKHNLRLVIIDYLQIIALSKDEARKNGNRDQDLGKITGGLKQLAKELKITIIVLSQLSREAEKSETNKRPQLRHLRESGNIEQDADVVMALYRPAYYLEREQQGIILAPEILREAELNWLKHRNGDLGKIDLIFKGEIASFYDPDDFGTVMYSDGNNNWMPYKED